MSKKRRRREHGSISSSSGPDIPDTDVLTAGEEAALDAEPIHLPPDAMSSSYDGPAAKAWGSSVPNRPGKTLSQIPPDFEVNELNAEAKAEYWHLPRSVWEPINRKVTGKGIIIANLDTGYNASHPLIPKPLAVRSFVSNTAADGNGHGSHCIGTNCGRDPSISPAFEADLIVGKVLSDNGSGPSSAIAQAIKWAVDAGAHVISMSLGGPDAYGPTREACAYAESKGVIVVAAAGNDGYNGGNTVGFPGKFKETLCIGAIKEDGTIATFSSGGVELDIATPGQNIVSCSHKGAGFAKMSGTSMATPFAAALCALILELHLREGKPWIKGTDAWRSFLKLNVEDKGPAGKDPRYGYGVPRYTDIVHTLANDDIKWT